jgi:hypothetical protein
MEVILDRIAAWAPRRQVFQLFDIEDEPRHVGTFSTLEKANAFLPGRNTMVKVEYLDDPLTIPQS